MKRITILCGVLLTVSAVPKDAKTTLDDIERDYVSNQRKNKPNSPTSNKITPPAQSPTLFGFVPIKTAADYIQKEPNLSYLQTQYIQQYPQTDFSQYTTTPRYTTSNLQKYSTGSQQFSSPQYSRTQQKYVPQAPAQQSYRYIQQVQSQGQPQDYENVQYITDNSIGQAAAQYYTPQYFYLQQYPSPSTAVQTVVDPKAGIQYVMYIPTYVPTQVADQTQNYESIVYAPPDAQDSSSASQTTDSPQTAQQVQYVSQPEPQKQQVQYVQPKNRQSKPEYIIRREPKSLLDSYIPSIVQLQYYNQGQQNSIQQPAKVSSPVRGGKEKSSSKSEGPVAAETSLTYRYQPIGSFYRS